MANTPRCESRNRQHDLHTRYTCADVRQEWVGTEQRLGFYLFKVVLDASVTVWTAAMEIADSIARAAFRSDLKAI